MTAIQWSDDLSVNDQEIDLQHRRLIKLIGDLGEGLATGADRSDLDKVLRELNSYVREHFTSEERLMRRFGFPGLEEHMAEHEAFVDKLLNLELDHLGGRLDISRDLLDYLEKWFLDHVSGLDQAYAKFFQETGSF